MNRLFRGAFSLENYRAVLRASEFWPAMITTILYTTGGAIGAIILGVLSAQLVNAPFAGKALMRGLCSFPTWLP